MWSIKSRRERQAVRDDVVEMGRIEAAVRGGLGRGSDVPPARHSLPLPSSILLILYDKQKRHPCG